METTSAEGANGDGARPAATSDLPGDDDTQDDREPTDDSESAGEAGGPESGDQWVGQPILETVSAGQFHTCWVKGNSSVACWGNDEYGQATPPEGGFTSVGAGSNHTCGVRTDGLVACWGLDSLGQTKPRRGKFTSISTGDSHTCGVRADGSVGLLGQ